MRGRAARACDPMLPARSEPSVDPSRLSRSAVRACSVPVSAAVLHTLSALELLAQAQAWS